jgi:hypothetical protein
LAITDLQQATENRNFYSNPQMTIIQFFPTQTAGPVLLSVSLGARNALCKAFDTICLLQDNLNQDGNLGPQLIEPLMMNPLRSLQGHRTVMICCNPMYDRSMKKVGHVFCRKYKTCFKPEKPTII